VKQNKDQNSLTQKLKFCTLLNTPKISRNFGLQKISRPFLGGGGGGAVVAHLQLREPRMPAAAAGAGGGGRPLPGADADVAAPGLGPRHQRRRDGAAQGGAGRGEQRPPSWLGGCPCRGQLLCAPVVQLSLAQCLSAGAYFRRGGLGLTKISFYQ
jgi:hypothetical protein